MPEHLGIVSTVRKWLDKAPRDKGVFHHPPGKKPVTQNLKQGDIVLVYLRDENAIAAEFIVKGAKIVTGKEFKEKYSSIAVEVDEAY